MPGYCYPGSSYSEARRWKKLTLDELTQRLTGKYMADGSFQAICPCHDDKKASLNIRQSDEGKLLFCCYAGCKTEDILKAMDLEWKDAFNSDGEEFSYHEKRTIKLNGKSYSIKQIKDWSWTEEVYEYPNKENLPYILNQRKKDAKGCMWSHVGDGKFKSGLNGKTPIPYRLPEILKGIEEGKTIYLPEGEKDVETLRAHGLIASTNLGGSQGWKSGINKWFKDAKIVILYDNDKAGKDLLQTKIKNLSGIAKEIKVIDLPGVREKEDITDWLQAGHTIEEFHNLVKNTLPYSLPVAKNEEEKFNSDLILYTDTWNGEQFATRHGKDICYCEEWSAWYIWSGQKWEEDKLRKIQYLAKETVKFFYKRASEIDDDKERKKFINHIQISEGMTRRKAMIEAASCEKNISISPQIFDQNKWLLNLRNGTLDLQSGELQEHKRENFITKIIDINYNPAADCPTWKDFLSKIFDNNQEIIKFVKKAIGYSLTGLTIEQCIFILHGNGSNGKSTFVNMVKEILEGYAQQTPSETLMEKKNSGGVPNDLARLRGARFVASIETEQGKNFAEALVKQISGDDTITARFLRKEFFEFKPECKIWIATNHKPKIKNTDHAIWRRIKLIPFTVTISEEDKDLNFMDKLRNEKEGILNWMIEGCKDWQNEGLKTPEVIAKATQNYREEMDVIGAFMDECCISGIGYRVSAKELYDNYVKWGEENGEYVISQRLFGLRLSERGFEREKCYSGVNRKKFVYLGIGLLYNAPDAPEAPEDLYSNLHERCKSVYSESRGAKGGKGGIYENDNNFNREDVPF